MKANTKLKMLPFDYLERIGRYDPKVHTKEADSPGYPSIMMKELEMVAKKGEKMKFIRNWEPLSGVSARYKHKKFITVEIGSSKNKWTIPSNWVARV